MDNEVSDKKIKSAIPYALTAFVLIAFLIISLIIVGIFPTSSDAAYGNTQPQNLPSVATGAVNPNTINGLDISASDFQVFIAYTPEPHAKIMRVEYLRGLSQSGTIPAPFDFQVNSTPIKVTLQRYGSLAIYGQEGIRVTIIYDGNVVKYTEFKT